MAVNSDGGVSPCPNVYKGSRDFGQLEADCPTDVDALWNNEKFQSARALFTAKDWEGRKRTVCDGCDIFKQHASKAQARAAAKAQAAKPKHAPAAGVAAATQHAGS